MDHLVPPTRKPRLVVSDDASNRYYARVVRDS